MQSRLDSKYLKFKDPTPWSVLIAKTEGSSNENILYYFHGGSSHPRSWIDKPELKRIRDHWEVLEFEPPIVASVSFGEHWLLAPKNGCSMSGLFEVFVDHVMPKIEKIISANSGDRIVFGGSMGGFNAAQLILRRPDLFRKAVITSPGFSMLSIYASDAEIKEHTNRVGAKREFLDKSLKIARTFFPDPASWDEANPLLLGNLNLGYATPPLYVSCGMEDWYGFYAGAELFAKLAIEKGVPQVVWQSLSGGHGDMDPVAISEFIASLAKRPSEP